METTTNQVKKVRGGLLPVPRGRGMNGQLQIDIGHYELYAGETMVGKVYVEYDPEHAEDEDPTDFTVERWCLFSSYTAPSSDNTSVSVTFSYAPGVYANADEFQTYAETVSGCTYIVAKCQQQAP